MIKPTFMQYTTTVSSGNNCQVYNYISTEKNKNNESNTYKSNVSKNENCFSLGLNLEKLENYLIITCSYSRIYYLT